MKSIKIFACILSLIILNSCYQFSLFQSAKTVGKGKWQATGSYSSISYSQDNFDEKMSNNFELQVRTGINEKADIGFRLSRIKFIDKESWNYLSIEPKIMLIPDHLSFFVPVSIYFGNDINVSETFQISPGFIASYQFNQNIEANFSPRLIIPFNSGSYNLIAINFGIGLSSDLNKWAIRPEIGTLFSPGDEGHFFQLGVGFTINI